ncbi:MAG: 5-oxoprolinase subunit PxpA [Candidatus Limivivens sp.]|nr:5-oxoprolinase subunit PxpA [Candidatus Limivivens sp.]
MYAIDLNCDLGESFGAYKIGMDEQVIPFISSANIACGFHASDPLVMEKTTALCVENDVKIGAHPGYPDLVGFGRRNLAVSPKELKAMMIYQIGALDAFCKAHHTVMQHVKPHGAMYNMAGKDLALASAICEAIYDVNPDLILMALSGSKMIEAAEKTGLKAAREVFADRAYEEDGSLVARTKPGAMITDETEAISRVVGMIKNQTVTAITGKEIPISADSVCVHGDGPKALEFVRKIRETFREEGIQVRPLAELL